MSPVLFLKDCLTQRADCHRTAEAAETYLTLEPLGLLLSVLCRSKADLQKRALCRPDAGMSHT